MSDLGHIVMFADSSVGSFKRMKDIRQTIKLRVELCNSLFMRLSRILPSSFFSLNVR